MKRSASHRERALEALPEATVLRDRLDNVRRRKRAWDGQGADVTALRRQLATEREQQHDR